MRVFLELKNTSKKYSDILLNLIKNEQKIYKCGKKLNKLILGWH
jgi:hypothetical protein